MMGKKKKGMWSNVATQVSNKPLRFHLPEKCITCKGKPKKMTEKALGNTAMIYCDECMEVLKHAKLAKNQKAVKTKKERPFAKNAATVNLSDITNDKEKGKSKG